MRKLILTALLTAAIVPVAHADYWVLKDKNGQVQQASDKPIPGGIRIQTSGVRRPDGSSDASAGGASSTAIASRADASLRDSAAMQTVQRDVAKTREEQCKDATTKYETATRVRRIVRQGPNGPEYLTDAEADQERVKALQRKQAACGK